MARRPGFATEDDVSERILFLPLALIDAELRAEAPYLSRQIPGYVRNVLEEHCPGSTRFLPIAAGDARRRHWVAPVAMVEDAIALAQAQRRHCDRVVFGTLALSPLSDGSRGFALRLRTLRLSDGKVLVRRAFSGSLARIVGCALQIVGSIEESLAGAAATFAARERDAEGFEAYLEGLDRLLSVRTPGLTVDAPQDVMAPLDRALLLDPECDEALTAGLGLALSIVEKNRVDIPLDPVLGTLAGWSRIRSDDPRIPAVRADLLQSADRLEEALAVVRDALDDGHGSDLDLLRRRADLEIRLRRHGEARTTLARCLHLAEDPQLRRRAAWLSLVSGDHASARTDLARLVEIDPDDPSLWSRLGVAEAQLGDVGAANEAFVRMLGTTCGPAGDDLGHLAKALAEIEAGAELRRTLGDWRPGPSLGGAGRLTLARCLRLAHEPLRARLCLRSIRAAELDEGDRLTHARERFELDHPGFDDRYAAIAKRAAAEGGVEEDDVAFLAHALAIEPTFWPARFLIGLCHAQCRRFREAVAELDLLLEQRPESDVAWYTRGLQLLELDRPDDARLSFEKAIALNAAEAEYHDRIAVCHARLGEPEKAREAIDRALRLDADRASARLDADRARG